MDDLSQRLGSATLEQAESLEDSDLDGIRSLLSAMRGEPGAFERFQQKSKQRYDASRNTPSRLLKSSAVLAELIGMTPEKPPISFKDNMVPWNMAFSLVWLPWAQAAQYVGKGDVELTSSDYGTTVTQHLRTLTCWKFSWAVPSTPVLEFMVERSPKIVEVGAGTGYWARLLTECGADIIALDTDSTEMLWFPITRQGDAQFSENCAFS